MANKKDFIASGPTKPDIAKSHFDLSFTNNLTANFGKMYPLGTWLMPAGSHFHCDCDYGFDLQPLVFPVQTNMRFHVKFYKAPLRILWKNWRNYVSRGGKGYDMPYISRDTNFYKTGSLSDYMGVPSFQSTDHSHESRSSFFDTNILYGYNPSVGDDLIYFPTNTTPVTDDQPNRLSYLCAAPLNGHSFSLLSSNVAFSTAPGNPSLSVHPLLLVCTKTDSGNGAFNFHIIKKYELSTSNASTSYGAIVVNQSLFSDRMDYCLTPNLYFVLVYSLSNNFGITNDTETLSYPNQTLKTESQVYVGIEPFNVTASKSKSRPTYFKYSYTTVSAENNATHFMSVNGAAPKLPLLAFRWRMYEFIYNYFVRNERVTPFKLPDENNVMQQVFNQYLTNDGDGADSTTPIEFKFAPYEYDLFTTCLKKPTFGDAPLVGVSFTYDMSGDTPTGEFTLLKEGDQNPSNYQVQLDGNGKLIGISHYNGDADSPDIHRLEELINFGISINDLRNVSAYQRYLERMTKAGTKYENIMYEFFGTNPPTGEEFPAYLGGYTDLIRTDKVLNQTMSEGAKLGEYAGNAYLRSKGGKRQIRTYCQEDCYIMAVGWFSVTPTYSQKLDKDFVYTNLLDFVNPQFAAVSPQPVYDYQIAPLEIDPTDDEALHHVFGYNRPFAEAVSRQDECHGLFRGNMQNFIMQRIFSGAPELGEDFLYMKPEDMTQIFAVTETTDKIFGQIHFDVNATLPLPHMAIPRQI